MIFIHMMNRFKLLNISQLQLWQIFADSGVKITKTGNVGKSRVCDCVSARLFLCTDQIDGLIPSFLCCITNTKQYLVSAIQILFFLCIFQNTFDPLLKSYNFKWAKFNSLIGFFFLTLFDTSALKPSRKTACFGNVKHLINQYLS